MSRRADVTDGRRLVWAAILAAAIGIGAVADPAGPPVARAAGAAPSAARPDTGRAPDPIEDALVAGDKPLAERLAREQLAHAEREHGPHSLETARAIDRVVETLWRMRSLTDPTGRLLGERALAIKEQQEPLDQLEVAISAYNLGSFLKAAGDFAAAQPLLARAVEIRERILGAEHAATASFRRALASVWTELGVLAKAERELARARTSLEQLPDSNRPELRRVLSDLADVWNRMGRHDDALALVEQLIRLHETAQPPDPSGMASAWLVKGLVLHAKGEFVAAVTCYERALVLFMQWRGPDHLATADVYNNLGNTLMDLGNYERGKAMLVQARQVLDRTLGPDHPQTTAVLNNLGIAAYVFGDYNEARGLFEEVLKRDEATLGATHPYVGDACNNIGGILYYAGEHEAALEYFERSLAITQKARGDEHPTVGRVLDNLGAVLLALGEHDRAVAAFERGLPLLERAKGELHVELAAGLNDYGKVLAEMGDTAAARSSLERALAIRSEALGPDHPDVGRSHHNLGNLLASAGEVDAARDHLTQAVAIVERGLGPEHPDLGQVLQDLGMLLLAEGRLEEALAASLRAEGIGRAQLKLVARGLSERQALRYAAVRPRGIEIALGAALQAPRPDQVRGAWDALIRSRALVLDEMASRHWTSATSPDSIVARIAEELQSARTRLANLAVRGPTSSRAAHDAAVAQAMQDKEAAERALAGRVDVLAAQDARDRVGFAEVAAALPRGCALVSYSRARVTSTRMRYCALILRPGPERVAAVALPPEATVDSLVARWRGTIAEGAAPAGPLAEQADSACWTAGAALRAALWDPLLPHLAGVDRVHIVPEGALYLVAFDALPSEDGRYLLESNLILHTLATERDLVPVQWNTPPALGRAAPFAVSARAGLLAVGGPDFDADPQHSPAHGASAPAASVFRGSRSACDDPANLHFLPLPGAAAETATIAAIYGQQGENHRAAVAMGSDATEALFKREASGRGVVHVATHGFVLGDACGANPDGTPIPWSITSSSGRGAPRSIENPLLSAGLALAGANRRGTAAPDGEDGILTGEEIAALELGGTQWIVLSACDTGVGGVSPGEGVFGLRRAFQVAGARTLITSLWAVEDADALEWMRRLYTERFVRKASTVEAARSASLGMLQAARSRGNGAHPFHWAAFVTTGDWR